jgi:hypothetical protein
MLDSLVRRFPAGLKAPEVLPEVPKTNPDAQQVKPVDLDPVETQMSCLRPPGYTDCESKVAIPLEQSVITDISRRYKGLLADMRVIANSMARPSDELSAMARTSVERYAKSL